jgi:hypothetical protein
VSVLGAALAGRRLRLSVGLVAAMLLAVNALAGLAGDTDDEPGQIVAGATARAEAPNSSPTVAPTAGTAAGNPAPTDAAAATPAPTDPAAKPPNETGTPQPDATEAPDPTTAPTPAPPRTPVVLEGSGSAVTEPFDYPGGSVRILSRATAGSGGCAYIGTFSSTDPANVPADPSLRTAVIFLEGSGSDEGWVDLVLPAGRYFMEIESDCSWVVTVSPT